MKDILDKFHLSEVILVSFTLANGWGRGGGAEVPIIYGILLIPIYTIFPGMTYCYMLSSAYAFQKRGLGSDYKDTVG
jgi:hypothetical protein